MRGVDVKRKRDYSKQIEYQRRYYAKCRAAKAKSCAYCGTEFIPSRGVGFRYCSAEHSAQSKKDRDNARPAPSPEERKRWSQDWKARNPDRAKELNRESAARVRAKRGRADRTIEYVARAAKNGGVYLSRADQRKEAAAREAARQLDIAARREARKPKMTEGEKWRVKYRTNPLFRQKELQRLRKCKLKRKKAMDSGLTTKQTLAVYAERSTCLYCGCALTDKQKTLDHMVPLSMGGEHEAFNLAVACSSCNTKKSNKTFDVWLLCIPEQRRDLVLHEFNARRAAKGDRAKCTGPF